MIRNQAKLFLLGVFSLAAILSVAGCASPPGNYEFSNRYMRLQHRVEREPAPRFDASLSQIERGRKFWLTDKLGHYVISLPGKVLLWNTRVGNHDISAENEKVLNAYLSANDLDRVKVRINQYAPWGELKRLCRNSDVNPLYRGTFGFVSWLGYTLLPGRLLAGIPFLGDGYNPYTNTINIYSGHPEMMVQLAARAKDLAERRYKGTYATLGIIPGVDLYQEHLATRDTLRYFYCYRNKEREVASYKILFPAYGMHLGPSALAVGPVPALIYTAVAVPASVVGNVVGRVQVSWRMEHDDPSWGSEFVRQ